MSNLEQLTEIWSADRLDRRQDAEFLISFLTKRIEERAEQGLSRSYVLNLDSTWGSGKTFFLERLAQHLKAQGYLAASVNAWQDDYVADPLVAVFASIDNALTPASRKVRDTNKKLQTVKRNVAAVALAVARGATKHWARKLIGEGVEAIEGAYYDAREDTVDTIVDDSAKSVKQHAEKQLDDVADAMLAQFKDGKQSVSRFKQNLSELISTVVPVHHKAPLFVLIDELDRCRPTYAIELLERVKHLFETDDVVFIVATDTAQLQHSICAVYGQQFDSNRYLRRFFDRSYSFVAPSVERFVTQLCEQYKLNEANISVPPSANVDEYLLGGFEYFQSSLRDIEQCIDILRSVITVWPNNSIRIQLAALFPVVVAQQSGLPLLSLKQIERELVAVARDSSFNGKSWKLEFQGIRNRLEDNGWSLFSRFTACQNESLPDLAAKHGDNATAIWIAAQFNEEFTSLHQNRVAPKSPPYSIIRQYPDIVRSAGRLTSVTN